MALIKALDTPSGLHALVMIGRASAAHQSLLALHREVVYQFQ